MHYMYLLFVICLFTFNVSIYANDQTKYTPKQFCVRLTTNTTAVVQWFEPVVLREELKGYTVYYTKDTELPLKDWDFTVTGNNPLTTIRNIELGEVYTFRVRQNIVGLDTKGPISDDYNVKMVNRTRSCYDQPKTSTIRSLNVLKAAATSYTTIEVWWNIPLDPHYHTGYTVFYGINDSHVWRNITVGPAQQVELTDLVQSAVYTISLAIVTKSGLEHFVQDVTVKVQPEEVPFDVMVYDITPSSLTLHWSPPSRFRPIKYKISYDAFKEYVDSTGIKQQQQIPKIELEVDGHITDRTIYELRPNTIYNINITAVPVDLSYKPAAKVMAPTEMAAPSPLLKPDLYGTIKGGNIQILLPMASQEYGPVSHYYIIVVPQNEADGGRPSRTYSIEDMQENRSNDYDATAAYIAAKFLKKIPYAFVLGNGEEYGGYINRKLKSGKKYKMFVRAVVDTPLEDLFSDSPYSDEFYLEMSQMKHGVA